MYSVRHKQNFQLIELEIQGTRNLPLSEGRAGTDWESLEPEKKRSFSLPP